jgi:hypothetical protein
MKTALLLFTLFLMSVLITGCNSPNLVFTTYTKTGLDISATEGVPTQALFGYKRFEGAIIPVDPENTELDENGVPKDALSVFAAMDIENNWIKGLKIRQVFATGKAAVQAAEDPGNGFAKALAAGKKEGE